MDELGAAVSSIGVDARRLCSASFSAGRLIGYIEAIEATDQQLAGTLERELRDAMASVDDVRRLFTGDRD